MFAELVDIESVAALPGNKTVSVCGYVRKVFICNNFLTNIYIHINKQLIIIYYNKQIFKTSLKNAMEKVTLEISTNYNEYITVQIWRETILQTEKLCKYLIHFYI